MPSIVEHYGTWVINEDGSFRKLDDSKLDDAARDGVTMFNYPYYPNFAPEGTPAAPTDPPVRLEEGEALDALIPCMRESAQDTLAALTRRKLAIVRLP